MHLYEIDSSENVYSNTSFYARIPTNIEVFENFMIYYFFLVVIQERIQISIAETIILVMQLL